MFVAASCTTYVGDNSTKPAGQPEGSVPADNFSYRADDKVGKGAKPTSQPSNPADGHFMWPAAIDNPSAEHIAAAQQSCLGCHAGTYNWSMHNTAKVGDAGTPADQPGLLAPDTSGMNFYRADPALTDLLRIHLPDTLFRHIEPHLDRLGALD